MVGCWLVAVAWIPAAIEATAHACSCIYSYHPRFIFPSKGHLPANARGVTWWATGCWGSRRLPPKAMFRVERRRKGRWRRVELALDALPGGSLFLLRPRHGLVTGARYRFSAAVEKRSAGLCWRRASRFTQRVVVVVDPQPFDRATAAARLIVKPEKPGWVGVAGGGRCQAVLRGARVRLSLGLSDRARRWLPGLFVSTWVDGRRWRWRSSTCSRKPPDRDASTKGDAMLYGACDRKAVKRKLATMFSNPGLSLGEHDVEMRLWLPGAGPALRTRPAVVTLDCGASAASAPSSRPSAR